ncbi:hypothetical protein CEXT_42921 [Caerostris extrusa]|uniref:Uncharacterized protein n=1 Tax=Caerostris extrusa TaxID=172846 RepID=A0AAV4TTS1_CAEEX|nr:hypothetical protein CEXT_42921 [Caerostris extrusa]
MTSNQPIQKHPSDTLYPIETHYLMNSCHSCSLHSSQQTQEILQRNSDSDTKQVHLKSLAREANPAPVKTNSRRENRKSKPFALLPSLVRSFDEEKEEIKKA